MAARARLCETPSSANRLFATKITINKPNVRITKKLGCLRRLVRTSDCIFAYTAVATPAMTIESAQT